MCGYTERKHLSGYFWQRTPSQPVIPTRWHTATRKNNRLDFCRKKGKICSITHAAACLNISTIIYCSNKLNHFSTNMTGQYINTPPKHRKYCNRAKTNMARCEPYAQGQHFGLEHLFGFCSAKHRSPASKPSNQEQEFHALRETSTFFRLVLFCPTGCSSPTKKHRAATTWEWVRAEMSFHTGTSQDPMAKKWTKYC